MYLRCVPDVYRGSLSEAVAPVFERSSIAKTRSEVWREEISSTGAGTLLPGHTTMALHTNFTLHELFVTLNRAVVYGSVLHAPHQSFCARCNLDAVGDLHDLQEHNISLLSLVAPALQTLSTPTHLHDLCVNRVYSSLQPHVISPGERAGALPCAIHTCSKTQSCARCHRSM